MCKIQILRGLIEANKNLRIIFDNKILYFVLLNYYTKLKKKMKYSFQ